MRKLPIFLGRYFFAVAASSILLFSCKKNDIASSDSAVDKDTPMYSYIKKLGYQDSEIKDIGKEYLVDEDLLFAKDSKPDFSIFDGPKTEQYGTANYVGFDIQPSIKVYVEPSMSAYSDQIDGAIALWNNVINCRVKFTRLASPTGADITIKNQNLGVDVCGAAFAPMNGLPGKLVRININAIAGNSFAQQQRTIAHELGHCIGFRHTNWASREARSGKSPDNGAYFDAMHILGTPTGGDANSLMNGRECGTGATTLSNFDILALQFLYPANAPVAGTVPIFRYFEKNNTQDHFYTMYIGELGNGNNSSYLFEGIGFFAFPNQVENSVPVHRYWIPGNVNDHFYTIYYGELGDTFYESVGFYGYPSAINGAVPVHRYYNPGTSDHFYTKNQSEMSSLPGYTYEGIGWYAY